MSKKLLVYIIIISFCCINVSCEKRLQTSESNADKAIISMTPTPEVSNNSNDSVDSAIVSPGADTSETDNSIIPINTSEPFTGGIDLDSEMEEFLYGTWQVEKLLGFANSYNDASEYPTGQKVIGDEIIIRKDYFSSRGLKNYFVYQDSAKPPIYRIKAVYYNEDSFYRSFKTSLPGLNINDEVKWLCVYRSSTDGGIHGSFIMINNDRLILSLEATYFELKKVAD